MTNDQVKKLTATLVARFMEQKGNTDDAKDYSDGEYLEFAIEEAWQNGELEFLAE
jgi:hypothetical protein